jgi:hypothetical protein
MIRRLIKGNQAAYLITDGVSDKQNLPVCHASRVLSGPSTNLMQKSQQQQKCRNLNKKINLM